MAGPYNPNDHYHSLPATPYGGWDARNCTHAELVEGIDFARIGLDGPDYFTNGGRYGGPVRPRSPFIQLPRMDQMGMSQQEHEFQIQETVRKTNLASALANCYVSGGARHANIFPMMMLNGQFPRDFQMPRTVDQLRMMDSAQLDRILADYRLPYDTATLIGPGGVPLPLHPRDGNPRHRKLQVLLEWLGACRVKDKELGKREDRGGLWRGGVLMAP